MRRWSRDPLTWILLAAAALRLAGLFWGLPASDGWDDDGFAPRNFLTALALTWTPGSYFTYPPLHALLLALPALPAAVVALSHAHSWSQADVVAALIQPGFMTYFAVLGRLVNLLMSLGIIWCIGGMATLLAGRSAGLFAAGACALNFALTYYGQVSNLDVPSLFWACAALWAGMQAVALHEPRRFWWAALLAAAAVATKDQSYAIFALSVPAFLALWFAADAWARAHARAIASVLAPAAAVALLALLLVDGAITNPSGFARRLAFLTGPASSGYAEYPAGPLGWWPLVADVLHYFASGTGLVTLALTAAGLALVTVQARGAVRAAALLPALAIVSFTICFDLVALRSDARFLMPQAVLACVYIGIAVATMLRARVWLRYGGMGVVAATALFSLHQAAGITAAMWLDPRYDAELWLAAHVRPGDGIQTYGQNAYLPRFPLRAVRISPAPLKGRNPRADITEIQAPFSTRRARFIVVSDWWLRHYTDPKSELGGRRSPSPKQQAQYADVAARSWFTALRQERAGYRIAHIARPGTGFWPELHIHESLNEAVLIFERQT